MRVTPVTAALDYCTSITLARKLNFLAVYRVQKIAGGKSRADCQINSVVKLFAPAEAICFRVVRLCRCPSVRP